jgi:hypothetical protein
MISSLSSEISVQLTVTTYRSDFYAQAEPTAGR